MTLEFKDKDGNVTQTIKDEGIVSRPGTQSPAIKLEVTASPCKHNWHFVGESSRLRCERCKQEVGPWTTDQVTVPTGQLYTFSNLRPSYTFVLRNHDGEIGKLDFNGPEMVFTGNADESAQVFFDYLAKSFHGRLKEERQAELDACCDLLEGMHACSTGSHNYYLHAAIELKRLRKGTP